MTSQRLLSTADVAEMLQIPVASLHTQRYRGEHPGVLGFRVGRHVRFDPADLSNWLDQQKGKGTKSVDQRNRSTSRAAAQTAAGSQQDDHQPGQGSNAG
jgi:hypothetical protein